MPTGEIALLHAPLRRCAGNKARITSPGRAWRRNREGGDDDDDSGDGGSDGDEEGEEEKEKPPSLVLYVLNWSQQIYPEYFQRRP